MCFYQESLGGELTFQTMGESPFLNKLPKKIKDCIVQATLKKEVLVLQGSDMVPQSGLIKGNAVSLFLNCNSEEEIRKVYAKLSIEGKANHPLENTLWGGLVGDLIDKFGNHWILNFNKHITNQNLIK